jgi:hypothetical protein
VSATESITWPVGLWRDRHPELRSARTRSTPQPAVGWASSSTERQSRKQIAEGGLQPARGFSLAPHSGTKEPFAKKTRPSTVSGGFVVQISRGFLRNPRLFGSKALLRVFLREPFTWFHLPPFRGIFACPECTGDPLLMSSPRPKPCPWPHLRRERGQNVFIHIPPTRLFFAFSSS